jgi:hypothetical protein
VCLSESAPAKKPTPQFTLFRLDTKFEVHWLPSRETSQSKKRENPESSMTTMTLLYIILSSLLAVRSLAQNPVYQDATAPIEDRVQDLLERMTMEDKIRQMIMDIVIDSSPNVADIGAYLIGASDAPLGNTPSIWRYQFNNLEALGANRRLGIPLLMCTDAVHGQNL